MPFATVVCLDDLTRDDDLPRQAAVYDAVRAPIWHAAGLDLGGAPRPGAQHNAAPQFDPFEFRRRCGLPGAAPATLVHRLPAPAVDLLTQALPADALAIGLDMPPWLTTLLRDAGMPWLDLRLSPLAFGDDAYVELRTEDAALRAALAPFALDDATLLSAACLHAAGVRRARRTQQGAAHGGSFDDALVFLPQADDDIDLVDAVHGVARLEAQADALRQLAGQRRLLCLAGHESVRRRLEAIVGASVPVVDLPLSELLAMDDTVAFTGLNAAAMHQARWYGKEALALWPHGGWTDDADRPLCVPAHVLLSEPLWAAVLTGAAPRDGAVQVPPQRDRLRRLLGLVPPAGARPLMPAPAAPASVSAETAGALEIERQRIDDLKLEVEGLKEALRVVLRQTALRAAMVQTPEPAHG